MTLHEEQDKVQKAVSDSFSYLQEDPWLTQRVLANVKGEEPVKKKLSAALVLCIILGLAIIGAAYALISSNASRTAEFFGQHWNQELGTRLQEGKIAQIGESVTVGDAVITLDEIVYRDRGIYGVGTVRPVHEEDVLFPMDTAELIVMSHEEEFHPDEDTSRPVVNEYYATLSLVEKAKVSEGKMLTAQTMPLMIGVDEGTMLTPDTIGYYDIRNEDGSLTFSFEASDGFAVNEGTTFQIQMESIVTQINDEGHPINGATQRSTWTVSCAPVFISEPMETSGEAAKAVVIDQNGYDVITPSEYRETGTMPVYQAIQTDFTKSVDPEWFNHTGIASGIGTDEIRYSDYAILNLAPEALFYYEFTDDNYTEAPSNIIADRAWVREWNGHIGEFTLDKTELTGITLEEAQSQAEEMIDRLGIGSNQYGCDEALDLSLERIQAMGTIWEQAIADGQLLVDDDYEPYDYSSIPVAEEGYYLQYSPLGVDTSPAGGRYGIVFYINSRGIVYASVRNTASMGEVVYTPDTLITPDAAVSKLTEELGKSMSFYDKTIQSIQQVALTYEAVRADNKADGMVFAPVWMILYQDESARKNDYSCYALINAVDGTLIDASFR